MKGKGFFRGLLIGIVGVWGMASASQAAVVLSNGIYEVRVQDRSDGLSVGSWTAFTGAGHPAGVGRDLLYEEVGGVTTQDTNFSSLRIYGPGGATRDYTFDGVSGGVDLDPFVTLESASPFALNGHRTVWDITLEDLVITQDVVIAGSSFADSAIYHTVELTNTGANATSVGWRNLYDWQLDDPATDDGPSNQVELSDGTVVVPESSVEFSYTPDSDEIVRVKKYPVLGATTYEPLLALGFDPAFLPALAVTLPDQFVFAHWESAFDTGFDFTPGIDTVPGLDIATLDFFPDGDSAGLSWFGRDASSALGLGPGESVRVTQVLFGVLPDAPPPEADVVPEPATFALMGTGLAALGLRFRRKSTGSARTASHP